MMRRCCARSSASRRFAAPITLTFFEYNTLAALEIFRGAQVSIMVLEVGLGGRLDATNIIDADVAVLCSVGMDHRDWLGDTLEQIGAEKSGIFRQRQAVVLGSADMPASVWQRLQALECRVHTAGRDFSAVVDSADPAGRWSYVSGSCRLQALPPPALAGTVQYRNAAAALTALNLLAVSGACERERVVRGLGDVRLPGRFQIVPGQPEWILDVAHNEPAAGVLAAALQARPCAGRTYGVIGMLGDKDVAAVAGALDHSIDCWLLAALDDEPRGLSAETLQHACRRCAARSSAAGAWPRPARARARWHSRRIVWLCSARFMRSDRRSSGLGYTDPAAMENRLKERLTGAAILVALIVLLVPEMFHGQRGDTAAPASSGDGPPIRSYTIDLSNSPASTAPLQPTPPAASTGASTDGGGEPVVSSTPAPPHLLRPAHR